MCIWARTAAQTRLPAAAYSARLRAGGDTYSASMTRGPTTVTGTPFSISCPPNNRATGFEWFGDADAIGRRLLMRCSNGGAALSVPFVVPTTYSLDTPAGLGGISSWSGNNLLYGFTAFGKGGRANLTVGGSLGSPTGYACSSDLAVVSLQGNDGLALFDPPVIMCQPSPPLPGELLLSEQQCCPAAVQLLLPVLPCS